MDLHSQGNIISAPLKHGSSLQLFSTSQGRIITVKEHHFSTRQAWFITVKETSFQHQSSMDHHSQGKSFLHQSSMDHHSEGNIISAPVKHGSSQSLKIIFSTSQHTPSKSENMDQSQGNYPITAPVDGQSLAQLRESRLWFLLNQSTR